MGVSVDFWQATRFALSSMYLQIVFLLTKVLFKKFLNLKVLCVLFTRLKYLASRLGCKHRNADLHQGSTQDFEHSSDMLETLPCKSYVSRLV